jgi:hypothetical protein
MKYGGPVNEHHFIEWIENGESEVGFTDVDASSEAAIPLEKLFFTSTRSLGGFFDYENWRDCDRFLELDARISCQRHEYFARCLARSNEAVSLVRDAPAGRAGCERVFELTTEYAGARGFSEIP